MDTYSVTGVAAAVAGAGADECVFNFWNPDSLKRVRLLEASAWRNGTVQSRLVLRRTTTRGTPGSTVTPVANNAWKGADPPSSGVVLDLSSFSVQPTRVSPGLLEASFNTGTGTQGMGFIWASSRGIWVPPGTGICGAHPATAAGSEFHVTVVWEE